MEGAAGGSRFLEALGKWLYQRIYGIYGCEIGTLFVVDGKCVAMIKYREHLCDVSCYLYRACGCVSTRATSLSIVIKYQPALYNVFEVEIEKHILYELRLEAHRTHKELYVVMVLYGRC